MKSMLIGCVGFGLLALTSVSLAEAPATQPSKPVPADQMLSKMLRPAPDAGKTVQGSNQPPAIDRSTGPGAVAPNAPTLTVMREGSYLVDRTGRLTRSADGQQQEFTFDSDGKAMKDPPVMILPNLKLMAMEQAVKGNTRDLRFRITGMVTEYNGRNYVLLEKVVVVPDTQTQF